MPPIKLPSLAAADSVGILYALLPGLVTFLVSRALTERAKKIEATEAVLYGLAYTLLVHAAWSLLAMTRVAAVPAAAAEPLIAVVLGVLIAWVSNAGWLYRLLRWIGVTRETSSSSVWITAFEEATREGIEYAVLYLNDGRRLYGNVRGVSDEPADGHVLLGAHRWLDGEPSNDGAMQGGFLVVKHLDILLVEFVPTVRRTIHA